MNLTGVFAINAVVMVLKHFESSMVSENVRDIIKAYGGDHFSVETIGRRLREQAANGLLGSEDVKVNGKKYRKFYYLGDL